VSYQLNQPTIVSYSQIETNRTKYPPRREEIKEGKREQGNNTSKDLSKIK